ncbi:MAG: sensor histidine kinase [Hyphomicrobiales bacterium]|nr:sensor histidine kinase [Hyphomicrobiales bacterium]MCP5371846.1 sensor histidine kinase [Hyphomicrobiales bacterium]
MTVSVNRRLILAATVWIVLALVATGGVLTALFRAHLARGFDADLRVHQEEILTLIVPGDGGTPRLAHQPADSRFNKPFSGWYWEVHAGGRRVAGSRSLWDEELPPPPPGAAGAYAAAGPRGQALRALSQRFTVADLAGPVTVTLAGPAAAVGDPVAGFARVLVAALAVLGAGLVAAVVAQVRYGLRPLRQVRAALARVRGGHEQRLSGAFPAEITGLVDELNGLLDHNDRLLDRARARAADLAHALKTPLAALVNDAEALDDPRGADIVRHADMIRAAVDRELSRARVTGPVLGRQADVAAVAASLRRVLVRSRAGEDLDIALEGLDGLAFAGDGEDLAQMLGNLMENACRWAAGRVRVGGRAAEGGWLELAVDDDGPGIPAAARAEVLARGRRLDESTPGSGLGLAIVGDLAEVYGGTLDLGESDLGGLRARLRLPAASPERAE